MMRGRLRVSVAAANRLLREALTRILDKRPDLQVVSSVPLFAQAVAQLPGSGLGILVSDAVTTPLSEPESMQEMLRAAPGVRLVLVGMDEDEQRFLQAVRAGVLGYVLKDASAWEVAAAVHAVAQGEAVCPPRLCRFLFNHVAQQWMKMPNAHASFELGLTRREQQLIPLIARRLTNKEIASQLGLSEQTVKNHVHRILHKVGTDDRLRVVEICRAQRWTP